MIFEYTEYYPDGGLDDVVVSFDNQKEAIAIAEKISLIGAEILMFWGMPPERVCVFDRIEGKIIWEYNEGQKT